MIAFIIPLLFFLILGALAKSARDVISFRYSSSIFADAPDRWQQWLNPEVSWTNKKHKFFLIEWLLSTVLVWATDAWHFLEALFWFSVLMTGYFFSQALAANGFTLQLFLLGLLLMYFIKGGVHELTFGRLWLKNIALGAGKDRRVAGEPLGKVNFGTWFNLGNAFAKSVGIMSALFLVLVGQLWLFRWIAGVPIHDYNTDIQWPATVVIVEFFVALAAIFLTWVLKIREENKAIREARKAQKA
jgi:hypothetical protein